MSTPTPDPRPEWITAAAEAIEEAAWPRIGRDLGTIHRDEIVAAGLRAVLPSIRADALREAADMVKMFPLGVAMFGRLREIADAIEQSAAPAVRPVGASAVPAEGSGHPRPFVECLLPVGDGWCVSPVGHDGQCSTTRSRRRLCDRTVHCGLPAGHVPPCTPMPVLSLDTPEGATTDAKH